MKLYPCDLLIDYLKGNRRAGINETIASYFVLHYSKVPGLGIVELAKRCNVSTPSVIRFCRELGYQNYTDFKECVQEHMRITKAEEAEGSILKSFGDKESFWAWFTAVNDQVALGMSQLDLEKVKELSEDILRHDYVYIFGTSLSGLIGDYLRIQLLRTSKSIVTLQKVNLDVPLTDDKASTLGIIVTQHGRFLKQEPDLAPYLQENCDVSWLVTQRKFGKDTYRYFDYTLTAGSYDDILIEYHIMLYVIQIIVKYCSKEMNH